jgi:hypothetical protein
MAAMVSLEKGRDEALMKNVKDFYVEKIEGSSDFTLRFLLEDNSEELKLRISRDTSLYMIEKLAMVRDIFGVYRPKDMN